MKQERMKILELLDQGKITAAEAASLLEALKAGDKQEEFWDDDTKRTVQEKVNQFSQNVESVSKDVGEKLESVFKEIEPKLRAATKVVVEKTAFIVDEISKSLNETLKNMEEKNANEGPCCDEAKAENSCCDEPKAENSCCEPQPESGGCCGENAEAADDKPVEN